MSAAHVTTVAKSTAVFTGRVGVHPGAGLPLLSAQLSSLIDRIDNVSHDARRVVLGRSAVDLTSHLAAGSWSVAECLDHVAQTSFAFLPAIREAIAKAPGLTASRTLRIGMLARLFVRNLEPPYRIRLRVLPQLAPQHQGFDAAWNNFVEAQSQLAEAVRAANGLAIDLVKVKSPVYARLSYNVYGALCILAAHERRHLWQMEQVLKALDLQRVGTRCERAN
jgi:hypothetical protein